MMPDLVETIASEGGKELAKALAAGLVGVVTKIPALWRRAGSDAEQRMSAELERSCAELSAPGADTDRLIARAEVAWETRLRDLLAAHPEAFAELEAILAEIREAKPATPTTVQNITASGRNSNAQGVVGGHIYNYGPANVPPSTGDHR